MPRLDNYCKPGNSLKPLGIGAATKEMDNLNWWNVQ